MDDKDLRRMLRSEAMTTYAETTFSEGADGSLRARLLMKEARIVLDGFRNQLDYIEIVEQINEVRREHWPVYDIRYFQYRDVPFYFARLGLIEEDEAKTWYREWMRPYYEEKRAKRRYNEFRRAKTGVLKRDGGKCVCCSSNENLVAHHIVQWRESESHAVNNLVTLCPRCHLIVHGRGRTLRESERSKSGREEVERIMERYQTAIRQLGHSKIE